MLIRNKLALTLSAALLALLHILWEYFNGGVVTHYPFADANYPGISNWWGLLSLPALIWAALSIIEKWRVRASGNGETAYGIPFCHKYFLAGLAFGLLASLLWELGQEEVLQYVMLLPFALSLFLRVYLPETTLGFVLGMAYTFGGVLPIVFALVIQAIGLLIHTVFNWGRKWLLRRHA